jgi:D-alanyl-lipoteichoic acid acyltransferase DltB (MBOAT superfamily)
MMGIESILIFVCISAAARAALKGAPREWFLYIASILAMFWLQPELAVRGLDFWLPIISLFLCLLCWAVVSQPETRWTHTNWIPLAVSAGLVLLLALTRYLDAGKIMTPSPPPPLEWVLVGMGLSAGLVWLAGFASLKSVKISWILLVSLIGLLIVVKTPAIAEMVSMGLRTLSGQGTARASALDLRWLGLSYLLFRIVHTLRDWQGGRKFNLNLREFLIYLLFFPTFTAGPIDRLERFLKDLRAPALDAGEDWLEGGKRLAAGLFKKFVLADSLALVALSATNAAQVRSGGWAWLMLYAYAFQIFFDFSGYSDIAIGLGRLLGFRLPENFNAPYLKTNLTLFWNNWHMTLTQWFRAYYFNPLTRTLRRSRPTLAAVWILLFMQVSTMALIGLWHGVSWNFLIWGLWHGLGLFAQSRYSEWAASKWSDLHGRPVLRQILSIASGLLTFHYVALGWVWFALPDTGQSLRVISILFGG